MPGIPVAVKTWNQMLVNQTITFVSLLGTMGAYVTGNTNQMIAAGMTCVGSSNGVTAAMDAVNRCTTAAGFAVRGANATTAQSWIVVSNGVGQLKFAYTGASDDIAVVAFSPGGLYAVAGTPTFAPTATDEIIIASTTSLIGSTASGNRVFHVWCDSTHRMWRSVIFRAGLPAGPALFAELYLPDGLFTTPSTIVTAPDPTWSGAVGTNSWSSLTTLAGAFTQNSTGGQGRVVISGTPTNVQLGGTYEIINASATNDDGVNSAAQGGVPIIRPLGIAFSNVVAGLGKAGTRIDWYRTSDFQAAGTLTAGLSWVTLNNVATNTATGVLWPWDGVTATCVTA